MHNNQKKLIRTHFVLILKHFYTLIVLDYRVETFFLEFLPITAKIVLETLIIEQQEVFGITKFFLQFEILLRTGQMVDLLFETLKGEFGRVKKISNHHMKVFVIFAVRLEKGTNSLFHGLV